MNLHKNFFSKKLFILAALSLIIVSFQNCSQTGFNSDSIGVSDLSSLNGESSESCQAGESRSGYLMSSALYPSLCGKKSTQTCVNGKWSSDAPLYAACSQQCINPTTQQAVDVGTPFYSFKSANGATQSECDANKITSLCDATTGQFTPAPAALLTCKVQGQTCAYTNGTGIAVPTGNALNSTVSGYTASTATYPSLCGSQVTRTCQSNGSWSGSTPVYSSCLQKCKHPDSNQPVDANSTYIYYTLQSGTSTQCSSAKVTASCQSTTGQFSPAVAATRYSSCTVTTSTLPMISAFSSSMTTINSGQSVTISWVASGATTLILNPGNINVTGKTSLTVSPTNNTSYQLKATNTAGDTLSQSISIVVASNSGGGTTTSGAESSWHSYEGAANDKALVENQLQNFLPLATTTYRTVYAAPPGNGSGGTGTQSDPYKNLATAFSAINNNTADRLYLKAGIYQPKASLTLNRSGSKNFPIIISTDPSEFNPNQNQVATIDFESIAWNFVNLYGDYSLVEKLEIKNTLPIGIHLTGKWVVIRNNHLHHNDPFGNDNRGIIMLNHAANGFYLNKQNLVSSDFDNAAIEAGKRYTFIMNNYMHDGIASDGEVNQGCVYTVTGQNYYMRIMQDAHPFSMTTKLSEIYTNFYAPPTGEIYFYNNLAQNCFNALATKNHGEGPIYFLSNIIYNAKHIGIKSTLSKTLIRNNIIYGKDYRLESGVSVGYPNSASGPLGDLFTASDTTVENNLIYNSDAPVSSSTGTTWNLKINKNVFSNFNYAFWVGSEQVWWYPNAPWYGPVGVANKFDLNESNPFWSYFPQYLKDLKGVYFATQFNNNYYSAQPIINFETESIGSDKLPSASKYSIGEKLDKTGVVISNLETIGIDLTGNTPYRLKETFKTTYPNIGPQR